MRRAEREVILADPGFGKHFTDHMASIEWTVDGGWHDASIHPYGPLSLDPSASVLHYAQEIFEGLKAYRHADGSVWTFRPDANARRFQRSARRLALPELPVEAFVESIRQLVPDRRRLGAVGARDQPVPAAVHDRDRVLPRGPRGPGRGLPLHREPGRGVLHLGSEARVDLAVDELRARRQGRHRCGEDRRQLRRVAAARSRRPTSTAASR